MITKITIDTVASFKQSTSIDIDKKIVLLYGLNGTGKTTISNYLYDLENPKYKNCQIDGYTPSDTDILVYNQQFIQDNFTDSSIKGIFTLSKENKEVEEKIIALQQSKTEKEEEKTNKENEKTKEEAELKKQKNNIIDTVWKIKTDYEHDTEFEFCLDGFKGSKESLFQELMRISYIEDEKIDIENLRKKAQFVSKNAQKVEEIEEIRFSAQDIEKNELFTKQIVGNTNSSVSTFIEQFHNSDWIKTGFENHIKDHPDNKTCPFCHQETITENWKKDIQSYFDISYQNDINTLNDLHKKYEQSIQTIPQLLTFTEKSFFKNHAKDFELHYNKFHKILNDNKNRIKEKMQNPSVSVSLQSSTSELNEINTIIQKVSQEITQRNNDIDNKEKVRQQIKTDFWKKIRQEYQKNIALFQKQEKEFNNKINELDTQIKNITSNINSYTSQISEQQGNSINIDAAITSININLQDIGITNFSIKKYENDERDYFYYIHRDKENDDAVFKTLSEGEKMLISFLYFIELCRGKKQANQMEKKKIIIIDDPVSSLSHNHVFNIAQIISHKFFIETYEQIFLFTHNLFFFNELRKIIKPEKHTQLIRITKGKSGSSLCSMKKNEILNDYQAYWEIIKNPDVHPTLLANSMRNILEYFFGFMERKKLNDILQQDEFKNNIKYSSFYRYINRESHSDITNISDMKDFDYETWKVYFKEFFYKTHHNEHYDSFMFS